MAMPEENPFDKMTDRSYPENWPELTGLYVRANAADSVTGLRLTEQIREVARRTGSDYWALEADFFAVNYRHREEVRNRPENGYDTPQAIADLERIAQQALERHHPGIRIRALEAIMRAYRDILHDYEMAFEYSRLLASELEGVDASVYTDKLQSYRMIGDLYYMFRDQEEAAFYYAKLLEDREAAYRQRSLQPAYANLGLIAGKKDNDLARSDSLYYELLRLSREGDEAYRQSVRVWDGIVYSQLADNRYREKEYDQAIPLYTQSLEIMADYNDPHFMAGSAIRLADIYRIKGNLNACKRLLDQAREYIGSSFQQSRYHELYPVLSKYYAAQGDRAASMAYLDSAIIALETYNKQFSALQLLRSEQRAFKLEQKAHEEELHTERVRSLGYRSLAFTILAAFLVVSGLLIYIIRIYRKKQAAYRELVRRAQAWATESASPLCEPAQEEPAREEKPVDDDDVQSLEISRTVVALMETDKIYLDPDLTLDTLATRLKINRSYLSKAINRCIGKKFTDYVSEYRIREAIRLLNDPQSRQNSFDWIAIECGFNDRITFYRAFKKITGLSPSEYRRNLE